MDYLSDFLKQKAPRAGREMPVYYRRALIIVEQLLAVYFPISFLLFAWANQRWVYTPLAMLALTVLCIANLDRLGLRANLAAVSGIILFWCGWYAHSFGWTYGGQHFILIVLVLVFFNVCEPPWLKIGCFIGLLAYRMALFSHTLGNEPAFSPGRVANIVMQSFNSVTLFVMLASLCILFSSNLQATERKLRLDNQELHREAGTDPLTRLPNRRAMMDGIDRYCRMKPDEPYCVAIADIDLFKRVNDTYGHSCGDYTLKALADKFRELAEDGDYSVCRWGGEEFCFFLPGKNLDEGGRLMQDVNVAVGRMALSFEGVDFRITITIGVEEYDFHSTMQEILNRADQKLYMGKNSGRDKVVI